MDEQVRTSAKINHEELEFIRSKGYSISTVTKMAIDELQSGKINPDMLLLPTGDTQVSIWITREQREYLKQNKISLSSLVRYKIRQLME